MALFFACCDPKYYDTYGHVFLAMQDSYDRNLRNYVEAPCSTYNDLGTKIYYDEGFKYSYMSMYFGTNKLYFLKPNYITEREKRQEAVFLIFANNMFDIISGDIVSYEKIAMWLMGLLQNEVNIDNLRIHHSIMPIRKATYARNFIRIDVPFGSKCEIVRQLQVFGVREDSLFPELEYTSKMLTGKYEGWKTMLKNGQFSDKYSI